MYYVLTLLSFNFLLLIQLSHANWGSPGSSQYHIQTDEGPERFFRYQTDNGQYRKEKRLQDGTVVGTNAWIDGFGFLRQNDYIADHAGYRILKAKTLFVGKDRPIQEAMKMAKNSPSNSESPAYIPPSTPVITTTIRPVTTPGYYFHNPPASVIIQPHSQPRDNYYTPTKNLNELEQPQTISIPSNDISSIHQPSIFYQPPFESHKHKTLLNPIVVLPSAIPDESHLSPIASTPSTAHSDESHLPPIAYYPSSTTVKPLIKDESHLPPLAVTDDGLIDTNVLPLSSTISPIVVSPISNDLLPPKGSDRGDGESDIITITSRPRTSYRRPAYQHNTAHRNVIVDYNRNSIDQTVEGRYNGVGARQNGFRYFLPRHYQEEVTNGDESRDGSYGYIDPFGIRRVVYYNAGKNGFVHRKNNRYVGFNATPYDHRPN